MKKRGRLSGFLVVASATMGSRVLGLVRDILSIAQLGVGSVSSAFFCAYTMPNLFRRLFGEGALTSVLIPLYSQEHTKEGKEAGFEFLNQLFSIIGVILLGMVVLVSLGLWGIHGVGGLEERWYWVADFGMIMMPYMMLICLTAGLTGVLNVLERFALSSMSQLWLNGIMIVALVSGGWIYGGDVASKGYWLSYSVLLGGMVQLAVPFFELRGMGWVYRFDFRMGERVRELFRLLLPGIAGAAIYQINTAVSRFLALYVQEEGGAVLYIASRLTELTLGVFTISVITVVFPKLSRYFAEGDEGKMGEEYGRAMKLILAVTVPAGLGLYLMGDEIIELLFQWGEFGVKDVRLTADVLKVTGFSIPFFSVATLITRGFHAVKDMRTPFKVAVMVFVVNLGISLSLVGMGVMGLAWANSVTSVFHVVYMNWLLVRGRGYFRVSGWRNVVIPMGMALVVMSGLIEGVRVGVGLLGLGAKVESACVFALAVPGAVVVYFKVLKWSKFGEWEGLSGLMRRIC